jgi:hypothetical protein
MIIARMERGKEIALMVTLEPGNIVKLKAGHPLSIEIKSYIPEIQRTVKIFICYTPDIEWVAEQMAGNESDGNKLAKVVDESLSRPEVVRGSGTDEVHRSPKTGELN